MHTRSELVDIVVVDGKARGIIARDLVTGELESHFGHAVVIATGGYGNAFFLSTNAMGSNGSAAIKAFHKESHVCKSMYGTDSPYLYSSSR